MIKRVFVVDDSQVQCDHAAELCRIVFPDAEIGTARDGEKALASIGQEPVDILLVDLEMPVMDGVELIDHIAAKRLARGVIVMSAKDPKLISSVGLMAEAGGLAVLGCIQKPLSEAPLREAAAKYSPERPQHTESTANSLVVSKNSILEAIAKNQFSLYYQPKLRVNNLMLKGVEALARWQVSAGEFISPIAFIDAAEQAGCIHKLTFHLLDQALAQKARWNAQGFKFSLAFNLSPSLLHNESLVTEIEERLIAHGIATEEIILEVTENVMLGDVAKSLHILSRLRLKGFGIALDDYGTGFANAEQLMRIPATELKLDRCLVYGISEKPQLAKLITSTIQLASELDLETVAEGVEDKTDFDMLQEQGIDQIQGFFIAKPMPANMLANWIAKELSLIRKEIKGS
ncbi:EAL domain-containing protein (putative c-di-GMP-specific phosphodiesterase class I) [Alteromonadaceae bacterium 2753L.S.0a.02]|nr:EAL domain-containing protein (putative c-di-GMP-specific phosphodiesterase class I) [Alteromonadaceae bacterium 2753L.S.0a.02]